MKVSAFTIVRNAVKFHYPIAQSIQSILPICDEFIVNVGDSEDRTLDLIRSIPSSKIRIIQTQWNMRKGSMVLSEQTNIALKECRGDWAFYLQSDEVIHENDLSRLKQWMQRFLKVDGVDALRFKWLHFYGSYWRYRIDAGWYQKQDRIIRNNGQIESYGDAFAFRRRDGRPLCSRPTGCLLYHYGWVNTVEDMKGRCHNAAQIGYQDANKLQSLEGGWGDLSRFPAYFGTHPLVMKDLIARHALSVQDWASVSRQFWWNPLFWMRLRHKTSRRIREKIT
ncbi:MAG: glycosyltransferase [Candidatus Omnitrophica bacterium]|nr:glycosyltransferase [Candidatus Omnitrophota bacterium]